jgi:predicted acylesterase/phospholipase RssA
MSRSTRVGVWVVVAGLAALPGAGCTPFRQAFASEEPPAAPPAAELPPPTVPDSPPVVFPAEPTAAAPRKPNTILALSGGGAYGAFTAGVLNGWTRNNTRPEFDVVTGVSTGALIAPLAFLGPKYDNELRKFYTEVSKRDVFIQRSWATVPFRDAIGTNAPLRRLVDSGLTDEVMAELAAEHRKGRRLYVATTRLETRTTVVWDLGAIACRGGPDARKLILDVMIASAAVPGLFPPVPITMESEGKRRTEMHVDGGVTAPVFVPPAVLDACNRDADLYVVLAGKYFPEAEKVRPRVLKVLSASGGALLRAHTRRDVSNLYHMARLAGVRFHLVGLRQDFETTESGFDFDPTTMNQLYVEGVKVGVAGPLWDDTPPERGPGEHPDIRTGTRTKKK